jgi:Ran GTPase-activating protein (RanGAP) involved in mRNA processing and transport
MKGVYGAKNLRVFIAGYNNLTDDSLEALEKCTKLEELVLRQNTLIRGGGLAHLLKCKNLKVVELSGTKAVLPPIKEFKKRLPDCKVIRDTETF